MSSENAIGTGVENSGEVPVQGKEKALYDCNEDKYDSLTEHAFQQEKRKLNPTEILHDAIERGDLQGVISTVQQGADPNSLATGLTGLHKAAYHGRLEICRYLVSICKVDVNATDSQGLTPLHRAAYMGQLEVCKYLFQEAKADIWATDRSELTPAQTAQKYGQSTVAKWLLESAAVNPPPGGFVAISGSVYENSSNFKKAMELLGCRVSIMLKSGLFSKREEVFGTVTKYDEYKVKHLVRLDKNGELQWHHLDFIGKPNKYKLLRSLPRAANVAMAKVVHADDSANKGDIAVAKPL